MMIRISSWVCGILVALAGVFYLSAPALVRWKIHQSHPEISFESSHLGWSDVTLHNVMIDKGWLKVHADEVHVGLRSQAVRAVRGTADVFLDRRPPSSGSGTSHLDVTAQDFKVRVAKGQSTADLNGVTVNKDKICFEDAQVRDPRLLNVLTVGKGCAERDLSLITLDHVNVGGILQIEASVDHIELHPKDNSATFAFASVYAQVGGKEAMVVASGGAQLGTDMLHVRLDQLTLRHPWIATAPVTLNDVATDLPLNLKSEFTVRIAKAYVIIDPSTWHISGDEACQTWAEALPAPELRAGPLATPDFTGTLSFDVTLKPPSVKVKSTCKSACTSPALMALRKVFTYTAYDQQGTAFQRTTGPDLKGWTKLDDISPTLPTMVTQLEDPGFRGHHGFISNALENSLIADVKAGKFSRGGSTITMQLAKNVWLRRDKTFGRKIQELLLAAELESCFSKDTILETYLNVVEFGPNVYGVEEAAAHYFGIDPIALDPRQALYLAWVLPRPKKAPPPNEKTMLRMTSLLQTLASEGRIPDAMLVDAENAEAADTSDWVAAP